MRSWDAATVSSIPRNAEQSMSAVKQAVADVGEGPDVVMDECASTPGLRIGRVAAGRKVLPIVEGLVLLSALVLPLVLQDYLTVFATRVVILALFDVFLNVGVLAGVPPALMAFALMFASSFYSTITPQGGSQNVVFVGSGYLTQPELYRLGLCTVGFCMLVYLVIGTPWLLLVAR